LKEVRKAAKRAKLYETQKVVKKLKDLGYEVNPSLPLFCVINVSIGKRAIIARLLGNMKQNWPLSRSLNILTAANFLIVSSSSRELNTTR